MARYNLKITFTDADITQRIVFNNELKKRSGRKFKLLPAYKAEKLASIAEYHLEGNISLADLGNIVSGISAKITRNYSFTILRQKQSAYN